MLVLKKMITNKDTLKLAYSRKSKGIIWKIVLDETQGIIVWESRTMDKQVWFYAYDIENKKTLLDAYNFGTDWNLSINTVIDGTLYLNGYESEFSPVQKGLVAFDLNTKEMLWQNFSIGAHIFTEEGIVVFDSKMLPRKYRIINYTDSSVVKELETKEVSTFVGLQNSCIFPTFHEDTTIINTYQQLNYNNLKISAYYVKSGNAFDQYIKVENNGELLIDEIINSQIQKIGFDTFFVWHKHLFYIRNKAEIVSYLV